MSVSLNNEVCMSLYKKLMSVGFVVFSMNFCMLTAQDRNTPKVKSTERVAAVLEVVVDFGDLFAAFNGSNPYTQAGIPTWQAASEKLTDITFNSIQALREFSRTAWRENVTTKLRVILKEMPEDLVIEGVRGAFSLNFGALVVDLPPCVKDIVVE